MSGAGPLLALAGGAVAGWICFAGLWGTVRGLADARRPVLYYVASLVARMSVAAAVLILAATAGVASLLLCLLGFLAARLYLQTRLQKS